MASTAHNADLADPSSAEPPVMESLHVPEEPRSQPQPQHHHPLQSHHHSSPSQPSLHTQIPMPSHPLRSTSSTPLSSPGLFSPTGLRHAAALPTSSVSESSTPGLGTGSPYLHPLQTHIVRETHKALIDSDNITGRKSINQYEVIEEIGRGMHGKVKLARNNETGENVAIKIIPRFSKKRRLGKVTAKSPEDKTKKEIAILKKIRHPNVVALLEVIDDPELKKIYMVLEHVELGEIVWRKKGLAHICQYERRRIEREMRGEPPTLEEDNYDRLLERRQALKDLKRAKMAQNYAGPSDYWSVEYGAADEASSAGRQSRIPSKEDFSLFDGQSSRPGSRPASRAPSRSQSIISMGPAPSELDEGVDWEDDMETPGPLRSKNNSATALDGTMYGAYADEGFRGRSPSMADSIISHMSSIDYNHQTHDTFSEDYSYVPCFSFEQARSTFRDTVLGLEYLHYQGVVHRDIKPANLLWTRDHRVRISDFGVSYFGRPIREGELDETVSESEARDFDDDLELAKTVGTPAFFAPELCYTDIEQEQPKVSEQIDVWSLGVTLYCLIYARIPFLADDEFQMFRKIATEDVYIPRRRLKPVDPSVSSASTSYTRQNSSPFREDGDLEYEDVDNLLYDLIRLMLTKNPEKRIRLRDIKRHPWVVQGISNPIGWLDDTDPARPTSGRRIQVNEQDMSFAVVPLTFLERARSAVKKTIGKVMHPLVERGDSKSRRRATSSAASSAGDGTLNSVPPTPQQHRTDRRRSIRPDDYFADAISESPVIDHHMAGYASTQTESVPYDPLATVLPPVDWSRDHSRSGSADFSKDDISGGYRQSYRLSQTHPKLAQHLLHLGPAMEVSGSQTTPVTPSYDGHHDSGDSIDNHTRSTRAMASVVVDDSSRSRSVDRGLFGSTDKRANAQVALSTANAPGSIQTPNNHALMKSIDLSKTVTGSRPASPVSLPHPKTVPSQSRQLQSDPDLHSRLQEMEVSERPQRAHRVESVPDAVSPPPRVYNTSNAESFARAKEVLWRKEGLELERTRPASATADPVDVPCPPSPGDETWTEQPEAPSRRDTMTTIKSSSAESIDAVGSPFTNPSELASPISAHPPPVKNASERMLVFQSDPSLPALLSGASSVSADMEGELLGRPGVVSGHAALLETTDSLTPPALAKEPTTGFPIFENPPAMESGTLNVHFQSGSRPTTPSRTAPSRQMFDDDDDDDDDDGSDDGILLMAKSRKKIVSPAISKPRELPLRRDTNASTASNETAKRVPVHTEDITPQAEA